MAEHISITTPAQGSPSRVSWGSIFAGVVVAAAVMFTLSVLCTAFGLGLLKPEDPGKDAAIPAIAMAGAIAWVVSALIATFAGAFAAGHLARQRNETDTVLHGLLVWGLGIVAMLGLGATAAGVLVGGAFSLVGSGLQAAGSTIGGAAHGAGAALGGAAHGAGSAVSAVAQGAGGMPSMNWDSIKFKAQSLLKQGTNGKHGDAPTANADQKQTGDRNQSADQKQNVDQKQAGDRNQTADQKQPGDPKPAGDQQQTADQKQNADAQPAKANDQAAKQGATSGPGGGTAENQNGSGDPNEAMALVGRIFGNPTGTVNDGDRSALVSMLTTNASLSQADATKQVQQWEQAAQKAREQYAAMKAEAEQKARTAAAAAAKALANAAWLAFVATVLAASAAAVGAHLGGPRETVRGVMAREFAGDHKPAVQIS